MLAKSQQAIKFHLRALLQQIRAPFAGHFLRLLLLRPALIAEFLVASCFYVLVGTVSCLRPIPCKFRTEFEAATNSQIRTYLAAVIDPFLASHLDLFSLELKVRTHSSKVPFFFFVLAISGGDTTAS